MCQQEASCPGEPYSETLWEGDTFFTRANPNSSWSDDRTTERCDDNGCWGSVTVSGDIAACGPTPISPTPTTPALSLTSTLLALGTELELVGNEEIDGEAVIHLRGKPFDPFNFTPAPGCEGALDDKSGSQPASTDDTIPGWEDWFPNRTDGSLDIWIDSVSYLPVRSLFDFGFYHDDRLFSRDLTLSVSSDFNTATIPD